MKAFRNLIWAVVAAGAVLSVPAALACGFENPEAMKKGFLNWIYPKSLYVDSAVWQAQLAGRIDREPPIQTTLKLFINPGYRKATRTLEAFGARLSGRAEVQERESVVVLLMEAMLWSRISLQDGQAKLTPHINAPAEQEAVIITHRVVLDAINLGRLPPREAVELGLMRLYGSDAAIARAMTLLDRPVITGRLGLAAP